jgi:hypothetical protein
MAAYGAADRAAAFPLVVWSMVPLIFALVSGGDASELAGGRWGFIVLARKKGRDQDNAHSF